MNTEQLQGLAFVLGPVLLLGSGLCAGVLFDDVAWQGIFGMYAGLAFVVVNLNLSARIAERRPRLGLANTVIAGMGAVLLAMAFSGYASIGFAGHAAGFEPRTMLETVANAAVEGEPHPAQYFSFVYLLVPLSWIFLGVSSAVAGSIPRTSAVLIATAGVAFAGAQAVLNETGEIVTPALMLFALGPLAFEMLASRGRGMARSSAANPR